MDHKQLIISLVTGPSYISPIRAVKEAKDRFAVYLEAMLVFYPHLRKSDEEMSLPIVVLEGPTQEIEQFKEEAKHRTDLINGMEYPTEMVIPD